MPGSPFVASLLLVAIFYPSRWLVQSSSIQRPINPTDVEEQSFWSLEMTGSFFIYFFCQVRPHAELIGSGAAAEGLQLNLFVY